MRQIQVMVPEDKGAEILELQPIPLARTTRLSIQQRSTERIVNQVLRRHSELKEIHGIVVVAASERPRFAVRVYAQDPSFRVILRQVKDDLRQRLGEGPRLKLVVVSARVL